MAADSSSDWRPAASLEILTLRARMLERIRVFFSKRGVLEVETPILSSAGTPDPALASLQTRYTGPVFPGGQTLYLNTSPEYPMKRLLAAGSGSIYQICKVFRDGESGRLHNPEFTMIEWYRVGFDHHRMMTEASDLVRELLEPPIPLGSSEQLSYREAFRRYAGLDPHLMSVTECAAVAKARRLSIPDGLRAETEIDVWRDFLLTHLVEPHLGEDQLTCLYDYPESQAALARVLPGDPPVAARFELYLHGIELANGFHELSDATEQHSRFRRQQRAREAAGLPAVPLDERLNAALNEGLPDCAGVAVGFDRLVMLAAGKRSIEDVLGFPIGRA